METVRDPLCTAQRLQAPCIEPQCLNRRLTAARRSGTIFYKPDVLRHCCPHYTIRWVCSLNIYARCSPEARLPVDSFKPSKDQRKTINHWNDHVLGDAYMKEASRLYPVSKEFVGQDLYITNTLTSPQRESPTQEHFRLAPRSSPIRARKCQATTGARPPVRGDT